MTMVAGCALPSGVIIAADTRITFHRPDGTVTARKDRGLKVFALARHTIIGFAGDCLLAGDLLRKVDVALNGPSPNVQGGPVSISLWLPPFLKHHYDELRDGAKPPWSPPRGEVVFMVGSALSPSLGGKETEIASFFSTDDDPGSMPVESPRRGMPWGSPDAREWTDCMGARNILYTLRSSNDLEPRVFRPLQFAAIGTGRDVRGELHRAPYSIYVGGFTEGFMDDYMRSFTVEAGLKDCGGLHPMLEVSSRGPQALMSEKRVFFRGGGHVRIGLVHKKGRWSQRNYTTGRRVDLMPPWMLDASPPDELFDDLDEAVAAQRSTCSRTPTARSRRSATTSPSGRLSRR